MGASSSLSYINIEDIKNIKSISSNLKDYSNSIEIPDDLFLCPYCDTIPEILSVHSDNGHIELKCKYHGIKDLTIQEYFKKLNNSNYSYYKTKCANCDEIQGSKGNMFSYCFYCKADLCNECMNNFNLAKFNHHRQHHLDVCIPVNEKPHRCLEHFNSDINTFCFDCQENVCDKETSNRHLGHNKLYLFRFGKDITKYRAIIIEKNKILSNIIKFNQLILNAYDKFQNNYFHIQSLINIGKSIEEENKRNAKELKCIINGLEKRHKVQQKAIETLQQKFLIDLNGEEEKLPFRKRKLGDNGLQLISQIIFQRLKDINVSGNNIQSIEPLNNMNLPNLEYINLSENKIKDINPLAELNCKKLKEIFLQKNIIEDFNPFLQSDFPNLEILRIENNNFNKDGEDFKKLLLKFNRRVNYIVKTKEELNQKYDNKLKIESKDINITGLQAGDDLLLDLYLIINPEYNIILLNLMNNKIRDASIISRFPLRKLELLDLSLNELSNINFILEMKSYLLKYLYLNDNHIKDISPFFKIFDSSLYEDDLDNKDDDYIEEKKDNYENKKFRNLEIINLKNNCVEKSDKYFELIINLLKINNIATDLKQE